MSDEPPIYDPFVVRPAGKQRTPEEIPREPPQTSGLATASLVSAILSFVCAPGVGGLLALTFGIAAKNEISRSEGARTGNGMAIAGATLGGLNLLASIGLLVVLMVAIGGPSSTSSTPTPVSPRTYAPSPVVPLPPTATTVAPSPSAAPSSGLSSRENGVTVTRVGNIDLVDIDGVSSLGSELDRQRKLAQKDGKKLLLWISVKDCNPCNGVAASLPDPKMQTALEQVRLVRVDAREYGAELGFLGIPKEKFPGFALLAETNRPVDFVDGGEWDEDIPRNIAPVLGNFVRGHYPKRRDPWRGNHRDDETTL